MNKELEEFMRAAGSVVFQRRFSNVPMDGYTEDRRFGGYIETDETFRKRIEAYYRDHQPRSAGHP